MPQVACRFHRLFQKSCAPLGATVLAGLLALAAAAGPAAAQTAVVTHHYDAGRSGWNATETVLTPASVGTPGAQGTFGLLATVPLDGPVDAQPLVVPGVAIAGDPHPGTHDVVYVATEANTIHAIDPTTGTVLLSRQFGTTAQRLLGCIGHGTTNPSTGVGISGTPVIDLKRKLLYVVVYTNDEQPGGGNKPHYRLHALDLATLEDKLPQVLITATQTLTDGSTFTFSHIEQRQRPALLEFRNTIYTVFGSFCDNVLARGWVMGWSAKTLQPVLAKASGIPIANLTNRHASEPNGLFLSSIWMSGAGPAADGRGIYYVTGNSDPSGIRFDPVYNVEQSVVRLALDTSAVLDRFAPQNLPYLDANDSDFGAGGVTLVPTGAPGQPAMAAAAGKFGTLYLLNRNKLGGYAPEGPDNVLDAVTIGRCWCQPAYFNDGTPTLVTSGGTQIMLWEVGTSAKAKLTQRDISPALNTNALGFFTSVSSNGAKDTIVWAVTHPVKDQGPGISLYAFGVNAPGTPMTQLFAGAAGVWNVQGHLPNIVPVVANGRVYVASDAGLEIFGLAPPAAGAGR